MSDKLNTIGQYRNLADKIDKLYYLYSPINDTITQIQKKQGEMNITLAVNTEQLKEHMKRAETLEKIVEQYRTERFPLIEREIIFGKRILLFFTSSTFISIVFLVLRLTHYI